MTKLIYQQWKADQFRRSGLTIVTYLNFIVYSVMSLSLVFALCLVYCISCLISRFCMFCTWHFSPLLWSCILYVSCLISCICMSCALCLLPLLCLCVLSVMFLALSFTLCLFCYVSCLVSYLFSFYSFLKIGDLIIFLFYIISLDKQLYVELVVNQYRCLVWRCWIFYILRFCLVSCGLCFLPCFLLCLLLYLLLGFYSPLYIVDLLIFLSTL